MSWRPEQAYVISLSDREDRRAHVASLSVGFPIEVVDAIDGLQLRRPARWYASLPALGCALSHRQVLARARGSVLIFEDDAVVPFDFAERVATLVSMMPENWGLLKLGGEHLVRPIPFAPGLVRCVSTARTHAYLVQGDAMRQALLQAIDDSEGHWDKWYGTIPAYAPDPFLVGTTGSPSSIPDSRPWGPA